MSIQAQIPALYYAFLLMQNRRKAQALLTFCATIATGHKPSARNFSALIGLGKSQAAIWIVEFEKAIYKENRTDNGQSQSPISGTFEPQNNYISNNKTDSKRTVLKQADDTLDGSNSVDSDVLGQLADNTHVGGGASCKRSPLKGRSSTGTCDSFSQRRKGLKIEKIREFQAESRKGLVTTKLKIEIEGYGLISALVFNKKTLLACNGRKMPRAEALKVWWQLYAHAHTLLPALQYALEHVEESLIFRDGQLFQECAA
jgi:hypothetical protein